MERIVRILKEQGEGAITAVCSTLKIPMFTPVELGFLAEYTKTMSPFAKALDVLQGEANVQMGWLVPTITLLQTCWTSDECVLKLGLDYIKSHLKEQVVVNEGGDTYHSSEEDFFSAIKQSSSQENTKQLETYLGCPGDTTDVLKSFPAVCCLSLRLNTALPASAACERLFSTAGLIFTPKRARVDSKNFENQLLLKLNKGFW
ncbi:uncharacterized protein LOC120554574 [Perca fluviatilis]|uniref:uncharacterized protein LOC120554574 n=1 Tax=Perca fluviatilis TaxID=8168 RepID=UPI0019668CC8|nr:uncharacterized protein LOC120554574 [Perca fluviatilis]